VGWKCVKKLASYKYKKVMLLSGGGAQGHQLYHQVCSHGKDPFIWEKTGLKALFTSDAVWYFTSVEKDMLNLFQHWYPLCHSYFHDLRF